MTADSYRENFQGSSLKVKDIIEWLKEVKVKKSLLLVLSINCLASEKEF
jgi:hypothetical protein